MTQAIATQFNGHPLRHVAIIMDGNNRWARQRGLSGIAGHQEGVERVREILDACARHDIGVLTLFAFSSENWSRPVTEVRGLMSLFASYLKSEVPELCERNIRLRVIGQRARFSERLQKLIADAEARTRGGSRTLVLAVDYGGRWEIAAAARKLASRVQAGSLRPDDITETLFASHLATADLPEPDLCIRTAGEQRISNFLLWQLAYSELYFAPMYWPDFDGAAFDRAVEEYHQRQRRFGQSSEMPAPGRLESGGA
ncbi:MAG: polyprenyl diphosphate synthase [Porticoccaceae bacterium]|jgi:undecaprenyl diphosphate synthase|nr:polyprenyl diphosphate synthase [Porticoccaceae bacterium]MEA3300404.1 polyprenyl diphosphate synthase [Pseudomonadota bacterium]HLS97853.1 polyprenyl diphosphate synthase [Porticoccaceae bacterium]